MDIDEWLFEQNYYYVRDMASAADCLEFKWINDEPLGLISTEIIINLN